MEETFAIEITATKSKAEAMLASLKENGFKQADLPPIPMQALSDFIEGKRSNIYELTINDEVFLTVEGDVDCAKTMRGMLKSSETTEFPLAPVLLENLEEFLAGGRSNVVMLEIIRTKEYREDLPGHV